MVRNLRKGLHMTQLEKIRALAKRDANNTGKPLVIYNLNRFNPLYVVRTDNPNAHLAPDFVERVYPD